MYEAMHGRLQEKEFLEDDRRDVSSRKCSQRWHSYNVPEVKYCYKPPRSLEGFFSELTISLR